MTAQLYHRLSKGCFRLLSLSDDGGVVCSLDTHQLDKAPAYIALSYTWGAGDFTNSQQTTVGCSITLNGETVPVQQNLHDALRHLAKKVRSRGCLFWVDAICINQDDPDDKNAQVKEMKTIYENASCVFGWLGLPSDELKTEMAIKMMANFNEYLQNGLEQNEDDIDAVWPTIGASSVAFPSDKASDTWKSWEGIADMLTRSYWQRTWIYQEATAPGEIWFFCGEYEFDDVYLSAAVAFGMRFSSDPAFDAPFVEATGQASTAAALCSARIQREKGLKRGLIDLMTEMRLTRCTDVRDKVFAPLGHAADGAPNYIMVDYNKSLCEVYTDVVRFAISHPKTTSLEFLGLVFTPSDDASNPSLKIKPDPLLPSWVPDWRQTLSIPALSRVIDAAEAGLSMFDPCPGTAPETQISGGTLFVKGAVLDDLRVAAMTAIWDDVEPDMATPRSWYNDMVETSPGSSRESTQIAICRALVGDKTREMYGSKHNGFASSEKRGGMVDWDLIDTPDDDLDLSLVTQKDYMIGDITAMCHGRRLARLENGKIAVVPAATKVRDKIAVLSGGKVLYTLRASNEQGRYTFIGECYVDGCMDGALMEEPGTREDLRCFLQFV